MSVATYPSVWHPPGLFGSRGRRRFAWAVALVYVVWSVRELDVDVQRMLAGFPRALNILARMFPPDFGRWHLLLTGMVESVQIALAATVIGVVLSIPLGLAAARNLAPSPIYAAARSAIVLGRTLHEVIIAIFCVKLFGFGAVAGLITLAFASAVFLGKMLAEDIENVRFGPVEAIRATGASFLQVVVYAIVPQVLARATGVAIYRLDANVRHSTVIGIVGAGGIGQTLAASFSRYDYDFSAAILLSIIALVALGEAFSDWVRRKLQ